MSTPAAGGDIELTTNSTDAPVAGSESVELPAFYEDDVVCMLDEDGNEIEGYGIILETAWDSEQEEEEEEASSDEDESDDEQEEAEAEKASDTVNSGSNAKTKKDESEEDEVDDDEDDEDEDDDYSESDKLPPGYVRVAWPDRVEEELSIEFLRVVDRSFLHGDVVVRRDDPQGQIGTVIDIQLLADVTFESVNGGADKITLSRINTKSLEPPHQYIIGRYVTKGAMLGLIQNCMVEIEVAFGSNPYQPKGRCLVVKPAPSIYKPQLPNSEEVHEDEVGNGVYFPGLRVRAKHQAWKRCKWLEGKHDAATAASDEGTVMSVRPIEVHVEWISGDQELVGADGSSEVILTPDECTLLSLWEDTRWQVGDHCQLVSEVKQAELERIKAQHSSESKEGEEQKDGSSTAVTPTPTPASSSSSAKSAKAVKGKKGGKSKEVVRDWNHAFHFSGTVTRTYTSVRVQWQDGTDTGPDFIPTLQFIGRNHLLENDFLPADYAIISPSLRLVHVLAVDAKERMVQVRYLPKRLRQYEEGEWWEHKEDEEEVDGQHHPSHMPQPSAPPTEGEDIHSVVPSSSIVSPLVFVPPSRAPETLDANDTKEEGTVEWVSVFELRANPHFEFCLGGAVIRVPGSKDELASQAGLPPDAKLGYAGQVVEMKNGLITVIWADLTISTLEVDQLMIVDHDDEDEDEDDEDDEDEEGECEHCGEDCDAVGCDCECHEDEAMEDNGDPFRPEDASAIEGAPVNNEEFPSEWSSASFWKKSNAPHTTSASATSSASTDPQIEGATAGIQNMSLASAAVALAASPTPSLPYINPATARAGYQYSSFDIIEAPESSPSAYSSTVANPAASIPSPPVVLQHKYEVNVHAPNNPKAFTKRVREEWKSLQQNLPPGIHVITYESRIDLFKILIVGNASTPFYLNIFQFDLQLQADYPASPPLMHFYSRGHRMNPNLYIDGNICLSLLNTWKSSHSTQRWDPEHSNLLQLFVSLQGLVIGVTEPYYLEAGYERQKGLKQACMNSHLYNETALLVSLQHLTSYIQAPLQAHPFVTIVLEHALNSEVQAKSNELNQLTHEWEAQKRAKLQSFTPSSNTTSTATSSTTPSETTTPSQPTHELDETHLSRVLAQFGIQAGVELHQPIPTVPGGPTPSNAATPTPSSAAASAVHYHPSLGFVTMLARQTTALVNALTKVNAENKSAAAAVGASFSSSTSK